jgi:hypothetical protein
VKLRVSGIYNPDIIQYLRQYNISHFSYDFRPTSFNFTQAYRVKEMLETAGSPLDTISIQFADEKDFVISEILKDIKSSSKGEVLLEFSGKHPLDFFEQFETPYIWHFNELVNIDNLSELKYLSKISFDHIFLERLMQFGDLFDFLGKMTTLLKENQSLEIHLDWDTSVMETLIDFFNFDSLCFEINNKVETSYRTPDLKLFSAHIEHTKRSLDI